MPRPLLALLLALALTACSSSNKTAEAPPEPAKPLTTVDPATAASVSGVIAFKGEVPKPKKLDMSQDPACNYLNQNATYTPIESTDGKLAAVFVYVKEGLEGKNFAVPAEPIVVDQRGCRYVPRVAGAMVGQTIRFLNSDSTSHNVHPDPKHNAAWNESQQPKGQPLEKRFDKPEMMVPVKCNQHPWMRMYLNVLPHPYFATTGDDGSFTIKNLPPGEYTIAAVHETLGEQTQKVVVSPKQEQHAAFTFAAK